MDDRIRVLLAIGEMSGGGSQRQFLEILRRLDRGRFAPHLYVVSPHGELLSEVPGDVPVFVFHDRSMRSRWKLPGQGHRARIRDLADVLRAQRIDVVYDRTYRMTLTTAGATRRYPAARLSVIVSHPRLDFEGSTERYRGLKRRLARRAYRQADLVLAVSEGVRQAALEFYTLPPEQVRTLYNFFDFGRIQRLSQDELPDDTHWVPGRFKIVTAGRLHPQKGFAHLVEALRILVHDRGVASLHLRILGIGEFEPQLRAQIVADRLEEHVTLEGYRPNPMPYYRRADLFCLPSLCEGMPNVLIEAMACGTPVLSADCPSGPREILQDGALGELVPPGDPRVLADAIEDALLNLARWQARAVEARAYVERNFAVEPGIRELEQLLTEHALRSRARRGLK